MEAPTIAIIGCGIRSSTLLAHLAGPVRIAAICDPQPEAVGAFRARFAGDYPAFPDHRAMLAACPAPWVMVTSPNHLHAGHILDAFAAGRHVFAEKPLSTTIDDLAAVVEARQRSGRMLATGFVLRYSPFYRRIKEVLGSGAIGELVSFEFNETLHFQHGGHIMRNAWRRFTACSGGHVMEKCCHDLDLAGWLAGSRVSRAASFGGRRIFVPGNEHLADAVGPDAAGRPAYRGWAIANDSEDSPFTLAKDIVDHQVAILEYENGVRATFHTNLNAGQPERRFYLLGTRGSLRADLVSGRLELARIAHTGVTEDLAVPAGDGHGGGDQVIMEHLARSMTTGKPPSCGGREGLLSSVTALAIQEAMTSGAVVDLGPWWRRLGPAAGQGTPTSTAPSTTRTG